MLLNSTGCGRTSVPSANSAHVRDEIQTTVTISRLKKTYKSGRSKRYLRLPIKYTTDTPITFHFWPTLKHVHIIFFFWKVNHMCIKTVFKRTGLLHKPPCTPGNTYPAPTRLTGRRLARIQHNCECFFLCNLWIRRERPRKRALPEERAWSSVLATTVSSSCHLSLGSQILLETGFLKRFHVPWLWVSGQPGSLVRMALCTRLVSNWKSPEYTYRSSTLLPGLLWKWTVKCLTEAPYGQVTGVTGSSTVNHWLLSWLTLCSCWETCPSLPERD